VLDGKGTGIQNIEGMLPALQIHAGSFCPLIWQRLEAIFFLLKDVCLLAHVFTDVMKGHKQ